MIAVLDRKACMGKRKTSKPIIKPKGRARDTGGAIPFNIELPPDIDQAIERYKQRLGPTKKWIVIKALEAFLGRAGFRDDSQQVK